MRRLLAALMLVCLAAGAARGDERWDRYQLIMWQDHTEAEIRGLAAMGFTATKLRATGGVVDEAGRALRARTGLGWYLENIATDFYASYHRFEPGRAVNWRYEDARARYRQNPSDPGVFTRDPGLSDPVWLERVRTRLAATVAAEKAFRPLFYNLADEPGIADLASAWDFDVSPASLAGMRAWLPTQYADLDALNRQWGTAYPGWDDVLPELTDAAVRRTDGNFSAWSDFKAWMDVAFARAVQAGTDAVHAADPAALAALEGTQLPGWGGYDYGLLAPTVDVMEVYDDANALDLATAFNPALIPLRTSFVHGPREAHAAWRNLLHGGRGMVVWDERNDVVQPDGAPGPRGRAIAELVQSFAPVVAALREARPDPDAVAVLHSQASFRVRWLLDRQAGDRGWTARDAEREYDDNAWRASRRSLWQRLSEAGVQPRFVSSAMLERGALGGARVLLLPHAIALSDAEVAAIEAFRAGGGTVLADTEAGLFDGHGRRRPAAVLPGVAIPPAMRPGGDEAAPASLTAIADLLREAGTPPRVVLVGPDGQRATGVEARWFLSPAGLVLALQAARPWGAAGRIGVRLARPAAVTDVRRPGQARVLEALEVALDPIEPTVLLLAPP